MSRLGNVRKTQIQEHPQAEQGPVYRRCSCPLLFPFVVMRLTDASAIANRLDSRVEPRPAHRRSAGAFTSELIGDREAGTKRSTRRAWHAGGAEPRGSGSVSGNVTSQALAPNLNEARVGWNRCMFVLRMKNFIESLSLGSGAVLIAVLSVAVVWLLCSISPVALRWLWVVVVPFIFAYSLHWLPVWLGSDPSEYSAWAVLGVGTWFLSGAIPSAILVLVIRKHRTK
jgi:hypothetical protein